MSRQLITVPQLFYGTLYQQGDATQNPIISSADYQKENLRNNTPTPLVGTLYRGMAEVEVHITHAAHHSSISQTQWYCLLADTVLTQMPLTSYDGFKQGGEPINKYSKREAPIQPLPMPHFRVKARMWCSRLLCCQERPILP